MMEQIIMDPLYVRGSPTTNLQNLSGKAKTFKEYFTNKSGTSFINLRKMIICLYHGTIELYLTSNPKFASQSVSQCKMQIYFLATTQ